MIETTSAASPATLAAISAIMVKVVTARSFSAIAGAEKLTIIMQIAARREAMERKFISAPLVWNDYENDLHLVNQMRLIRIYGAG